MPSLLNQPVARNRSLVTTLDARFRSLPLNQVRSGTEKPCLGRSNSDAGKYRASTARRIFFPPSGASNHSDELLVQERSACLETMRHRCDVDLRH